MAKKEAIEAADVEALTKLFCNSVGFHLGVVKFRPKFEIKKEGLYNLLLEQFTWLFNKGWSYGELDELLKEARRLKRMLSEPGDLVQGRTPKAKQKDPERNLLDYHSKEALYYHPAIKVRRMPCIVLESNNTLKVVDEGDEGSYKESFTLGDLVSYWQMKIGPLDAEDSYGAFEWMIEKYPLPTILHSIDRFSAAMKDERDIEHRKRIGVFDLKLYIAQVEVENSEASR